MATKNAKTKKKAVTAKKTNKTATAKASNKTRSTAKTSNKTAKAAKVTAKKATTTKNPLSRKGTGAGKFPAWVAKAPRFAKDYVIEMRIKGKPYDAKGYKAWRSDIIAKEKAAKAKKK